MTDTTKFLSETDIATLLGVRREYVRDRLVRRPDFPAPAIVLSQRIKRWSERAVLEWVESGSARMEDAEADAPVSDSR